MDCNNLCYCSERICLYCKENYEVSSEFYRAKRPANRLYVTGYLVRNKDGVIQGILNKNNHFAELACIDNSTLEKVF